MKARFIRDNSGATKLLCADGTIHNLGCNNFDLILRNFKQITDFSGSDGHWLPECMDMALYPGETLAYVSDDFLLVVLDPAVFRELFNTSSVLGAYISLAEYAKKVNRSQQIIKVFCREGRLLGAQKVGGCWMIPENTPYPVPPSRRHD